MPIIKVNGIKINFEEYGSGEPVVLVTGTGAPGRVWRPHQVPALTAAGYRAITVDNRGVPPSDTCPEGFTLADMVADTAGLVEALEIRPCRIAGVSLGAIIVQELLVSRPELISRAVLMATRGRTDALAAAMSAAEIEMCDSGIKLPAMYEAFVQAMMSLSPRTLSDDEQIRDWLEILEISALSSATSRSQLGLEAIPDRLAAYQGIVCPCLVIGFRDDLIVRPYLCREVAESIPDGSYTEIAGCGHYGYLEDPAAVNASLIQFFGESRE
jgi:pimeloyl-ACP methyl ester carboxylesterase